jgi:hypothetical protein
VVRRLLGGVLMAYAALSGRMGRPAWVGSLGEGLPLACASCASGFLGGAYNTNGPPLILYGASSPEWSGPGREERFKAFLQTFFFVQSASIFVVRALAGALAAESVRLLPWAMPAMFFALALGWRRPHATGERFRRRLKILIFLLGLMLLAPLPGS